MTKETKNIISIEEATKEVEVAITRVALLHLAFSKTLVQEFGKEKAEETIIKSIMEYGDLISKFVRTGGQDLPSFGTHREVTTNEEGNFAVHGCTLARTFEQFDELDLGKYYCFVDAAKSMAADPSQKLIHTTCEACGDDNCTFENLPTTDEEKNDFANRHVNWKNVDPRLVRE